jgi:threonylcarbamoyladenosine tRNA methylthiotransferase MtaB
MDHPPLAAILTLGCKLNLADSEQIARRLGDAGFRVVADLCEADAYVLNTCSVTHVADQKSRRLIRAARRLSPGAAVAVTGCYPRTAGDEAARALGADIVVGTRDADKDHLSRVLTGRLAVTTVVPAKRPESALHTRAFIKVQEGCNDVCAFCIVPRTRGREESRSISAVAADVRAAETRGAKEAVITGTQLGAWGRDLEPAFAPADLIAGLLERTEMPRVRFSSLQPQDITPALLALWQDPRLMPHFHLALQAGSDATLGAMRRRYTKAAFRGAAARIRAAVPGAAITTDVIAGFPGESEREFEETLDFCREMAFSRMHCFPFSPRRGTTAARLPGQVPPEVRKERVRRLMDLAGELNAAFRAQQAGATVPVLWEDEREIDGERFWHGLTPAYVPVFAPGSGLANRITPTRLLRPFRDGLIAERAA